MKFQTFNFRRNLANVLKLNILQNILKTKTYQKIQSKIKRSRALNMIDIVFKKMHNNHIYDILTSIFN